MTLQKNIFYFFEMALHTNKNGFLYVGTHELILDGELDSYQLNQVVIFHMTIQTKIYVLFKDPTWQTN